MGGVVLPANKQFLAATTAFSDEEPRVCVSTFPRQAQSSRVADNDLWFLGFDGLWAVQVARPLEEGVDHGLHHLVKEHGSHLGVEAGSELEGHLKQSSGIVCFFL